MSLEEEKKPRSPSQKNELLGVAATKKTNERSTSQRASNQEAKGEDSKKEGSQENEDIVP